MEFFKTWPGTAVTVAIALATAVIFVTAVRLIVALISKRRPWVGDLLAQIRTRWRLFILVIVLWAACAITAPASQDWWPVLARTFLIITIVSGAWLLTAVTSFGLERLLIRYDRTQGDAGPEARRVRTQLTMIRRLVTAVIAVIAVGAVLFTFPEVRAVGASVLASAGIISIIAGLAAQSTLGNVIAGIQLAFSDAIRVDDVVVVEGEWGRIGEITLTYVVVYVWDERRLILPSNYFTTQPFESWTRRSDEILGTVFMDLDWRVPVEAVRAKFMEVVETAEEWDGRVASTLVTDAVGGYVNVRFLVSAANSGNAWNLRCRVREEMVRWIQEAHPEALPVTRVELAGGSPLRRSTSNPVDASGTESTAGRVHP